RFAQGRRHVHSDRENLAGRICRVGLAAGRVSVESDRAVRRATRPTMTVRNLRLTLRYDGTDFQGWQTQPGSRTVQETLEKAIAAVTQEERIRANPSGRTDAGVHALGQVVNFYSATRLECDVLRKAINAHLPPDVAVWFCDEVPQAFC